MSFTTNDIEEAYACWKKNIIRKCGEKNCSYKEICNVLNLAFALGFAKGRIR